jgi:flavin-dependent dehydrogenase
LIIIVAGGFAELFVRDKLIVSGDAAATADNIMAKGVDIAKWQERADG